MGTDTLVQLYVDHGLLATIVVVCSIVIIYLLLPASKAWWNRRLERQRSADEWIRERAEKLDLQRDVDFDVLRDENRIMQEENKAMKLAMIDLERKVTRTVKQSTRIDQKLRNFQWLFLIEVCDSLIDKVIRTKHEIAVNLEGKTRKELADAIEIEFNKLIADLKSSFVVRELEKNASIFKEENDDDDDPEKTVKIVKNIDAETEARSKPNKSRRDRTD